MEIKAIDIASAAKMLGIFYAIIGFILGGFLSLFALAAGANQFGGGGPGGIEMMMFGGGAIVILPLMYGFMGLIGGAIAAVIYNVCASIVGGIKLEIDRGVEIYDDVYEKEAEEEV